MGESRRKTSRFVVEASPRAATKFIETTENLQQFQAHRLSVAPMMDWTDRHCRRLHRSLSGRALLYTEMLTAQAVIHGDRAKRTSAMPRSI